MADVTYYKGYIGEEDLSIGRSTFVRRDKDGAYKTLTQINRETFNVDWYYDVRDYTDLLAAATALNALSDNVTLLISEEQVISSDITFDSNIYILFVGEGKFNIDSGYVVTINSPANVVASPNQQIFSGAGTVVFSRGEGDIFPEWWGQNTTPGTTDMYSAISSSIVCANASKIKNVRLKGWYAISDTIVLRTMVNLIGDGAPDYAAQANVSGTKLIWTGAAAGTMLTGYSASNSNNIIERIVFNGSDLADTAINIDNLNGLRLYDCYFDNFTGDILKGSARYNGIIRGCHCRDIADGKSFINFSAGYTNGWRIYDNTIVMGSGSYGIKVASNGIAIFANSIEGETTNYPSSGGRRGIYVALYSYAASIYANRIELSWTTGQDPSYGVEIATDYTIQGLTDNDIFITVDGSEDEDYNYLFSHANGALMKGEAYTQNPWCLDLIARANKPLAKHSFRIAGSDGTVDGSFGLYGKGIYSYSGNAYEKINTVFDISNSDASTSGTGTDVLKSNIIPKDYLGTVRGVHFIGFGTVTNVNNGNKSIFIGFGSSSITVLPAANDNNDWRVEGYLFNTAAGAQRVSWTAQRSGSTPTMGYDTMAEDTTGPLTLGLYCNCADAADTITQTMWLLEIF